MTPDNQSPRPPPPRDCYVHVPFCVARCDYCAFYSIPAPSPETVAATLRRLRLELHHRAAGCAPLQTLYIGGGTPTALAPEALRELLRILRTTLRFAPDCEITVEANPATITPEKAEILADHGVNRVSLGVQTFNPSHRAAIGRQPRADRPPDLRRCLRILRRCGLRNCSLDLINALPGQSLTQWDNDLRRALDLAPEHLSAYTLTAEPDTPFARRAPAADPDRQAALWECTGRRLAEAGLPRYEISNYARPGRQCRHNQRIWHGHRFIAAGPSAAWFTGFTRYRNVSALDAWLRDAPPDADPLPPVQRAVELLITGLRTVAGWEADTYLRATGFGLHQLRSPQIRALAAAGLLHATATCVRPTERGLLLNDHLARELL